MRIKLDRTVCDGFGTCALHAPRTFSLDEWGYPSLVGGGDIPQDDRDGVARAVLDCPAHAIVVLDDVSPIRAGGEAGISRSAGPDSLWEQEAPVRAPSAENMLRAEDTSAEFHERNESGVR